MVGVAGRFLELKFIQFFICYAKELSDPYCYLNKSQCISFAYIMYFICLEQSSEKASDGLQLQYKTFFVVNTSNGNRTRAACLEGKHDNHFTIGV